MMRWLPPLIAGLLALFALLGGAAPSPEDKPGGKSAAKSLYRNSELGIALRPPKFEAPAEVQSVMAASFAAPARDGFAANLNVMVQPKMTKEVLVSITKSQFAAMGLNVVAEKERTIGGFEAVEYIYESQQQAMTLRHIAVGVVGEKNVYLLTGTSLASHFADYEPAFRAAIDSFQAKATD